MTMRPTPFFAAVTLLCASTAFADSSIRRSLASAADRLEDLLQREQRSLRDCRNRIEPALQSSIDGLDGLRPSSEPGQFDGVASQLASTLTFAQQSGCPHDVVKEIRKAAEDFGDAQRDARRRGNGGPPPPPPGPPVQPGVFFGPAQITESPQGAMVAIPTVTLNGFQSSNVYLAWHWKPEGGQWSAWESLPAVMVNSPQYVWNNPYRQLLDYGSLKQADNGRGRFLVHAGIYDMNGRELEGLDVPFAVHFPNTPPPPPPGRVLWRPVAPGAQQVAPPPPPPGGNAAPPPGVPAARDCGLGLDDPGCTLTRGTDLPMDRGAFEGFMQALRANLSESVRASMVRDTLRTRFVTARQLGAVMDLFVGENNRLDAVRFAAPHVVDPANALGFASKFLSASRQREYNQVMSSQR